MLLGILGIQLQIWHISLDQHMLWNQKGNIRRPLCGYMVLVMMAQGFDVIGTSEDATQDIKGLEASAAYVMSLLSTEPPNIKLGIGGFSMGAATAIYSASCFTCEKYGNGSGCPTQLDAVVALSGWLPCARALSNKVKGRASIPMLLCHGKVDNVVRFRYGEKSAEKLTSAGFENLTFKSFNALGHYINREEMVEVASWLTSKLELEGKSFSDREQNN